MSLQPLPRSYFQHDDVLFLAKDLLGKNLYTLIDGIRTGGTITETEAYRGPEDRASHAFKGRRTARTEVMYQPGGVAYIYLCYGIHHLFNIVTYKEDVPHAILIRAVQPHTGIEFMLKRRHKKKLDPTLSSGPGVLSQALGMDLSLNGLSLDGPPVWVENGIRVSDAHILASPRIGVDYAKEDALLPWRFRISLSREEIKNLMGDLQT